MEFILRQGSIDIKDASGTITWSGQPLGIPVKAIVSLPGEDACIALCDPDAQVRGQFNNLIRLRSNGIVEWQAPLPTSGNDDCYTSLAYQSGVIVASSWSGFCTRLDPVAGAIIDSEFTK